MTYYGSDGSRHSTKVSLYEHEAKLHPENAAYYAEKIRKQESSEKVGTKIFIALFVIGGFCMILDLLGVI